MKQLKVLILLGIFAGLPGIAIGQITELEKQQLQRDQQAVLRKAERLRDQIILLMERKEKEGEQRQAELLRTGLQHLEKSALLEDVAEVRNSLDAGQLAAACQKAEEAIADVERLLQILLDRQSLDKLEADIQAAKEFAATASQLLQRQEQLQEERKETTNSEANATEQQISDRLLDLAQMQKMEAQQNQRDAGSRQASLEQALQQIQKLLQAQTRLENSAQANAQQTNPLQEQGRQLENLKQDTAEHLANLSAQRSMQQMAEEARRLQSDLEQKDAQALAESLEVLVSRLEDLKQRQTGEQGKELGSLEEKILQAAQNPNGADSELGKLARQAEEMAQKAGEQQAKASEQQRQSLQAKSEELAKAMAEQNAESSSQQDGAVDDKVKQQLEQAVKKLQEAAKALAESKLESNESPQAVTQEAATQEAMNQLSKALQNLSEAQSKLRSAAPTAQEQATKMANQASNIGRQLKDSPVGEEAEQQAANKLEEAETALRKPQPELNNSRQALEDAEQALQNAMDRSQETAENLQQASNRQAELQREAKAMQEQIQAAKDSGELSQAQAEAMQPSMQRAQDKMQQAQKSIQEGQQSQAAQNQQEAGEALENTEREMSRNRPLTEQQRQQLQELADKQRELQEDIIRLAKLQEEEQNRRAKDALERAAKAADQAATNLEEGDTEEADQAQEEARQALQEATDSLEQERDRYQDLRQEELLFKIKDELLQFMEKQKPITRQTAEAGAELAKRQRLSRRMRRDLNKLGSQEENLKTKAEFLRQALEEEGVLVFSHALAANEDDLDQITVRLSGRNPDPGELTVVLQQDVEARTLKLLEALQKEQERREQERNQQDQQQQQQEDRNQNGKRPLVSGIAELQMLKQMEEDMLLRTQYLEKLFSSQTDEFSEIDMALLERHAHRHNEVTKIFLQLKSQIEQSMQPPEDEDEEEDE